MKYIFLVLFLYVGIQVNAQSDTDNPYYGLRSEVKITNVEQIFKNLSDAVDKHADGKAKILGYKYLGTVKDSLEVQKMVRQNILNAPQFSRGVKRAELHIDSLIIDHSRYFFTPQAFPMKKFLRSFEGKSIFKAVCQEIKVGYNIYKLMYMLDGKKYSEFVFVNSKDMQVATSSSFWGFHLRTSQQATLPIGAWVHTDTSRNKDKQKAQLDSHAILRDIEEAEQQDNFLKVILGDVTISHAYPMEAKMSDDGKCFVKYKIYDNHYHPVKLFLNVAYSNVNNTVKLLDYKIDGLCNDGVATFKKKDKHTVSLTYDDRSKCFIGNLSGRVNYLSSNGSIIPNSADRILILHLPQK